MRLTTLPRRRLTVIRRRIWSFFNVGWTS